MEVKVKPEARSDRHYVTKARPNLDDLREMAEAVAKSAGIDVSAVEFMGAFERIKAEGHRSLTKTEYAQRLRQHKGPRSSTAHNARRRAP